MASKKTIEIVKSTAPVLQEHGQAITKVFYKLLFDNHPRLKDMFNMTNQKKGTQQMALANAVFKYACHIDKLEMMGDVVETIAQKHTSLSVPKEAYPIVGENLLKAIKEVLGDAATPEIIDAWAEAYGDLAVVFTEKEEGVYVERENTKGGFRGKKEFKIVKKVKESDVITSFYLQREDGEEVPTFSSGQYVSVTVEIPNTSHKHTRTYSLSDTNDKDYLRISVKKEVGAIDGIVSNFLHESKEVGDILTLGMPSGEFVYKESNRPLVLIGGGVGVTPLLSMYKNAVAESRQDITFIQCALDSSVIAFKDEVSNLSNNNVKTAIIYSDASENDVLGKDFDFEGYLDKSMFEKLQVSKESDFYFCGPRLFMSNVLAILEELDIAQSQINYEFFGPYEDLT